MGRRGEHMRLANGARWLLEARMAGKRPAWPVVVTDELNCASIHRKWGFAVLLAGPGVWDMTCLRDLKVWVFACRQDVLGLVESVAIGKPADLVVLDGPETVSILERFIAWRNRGATH